MEACNVMEACNDLEVQSGVGWLDFETFLRFSLVWFVEEY